MTFLYLTDKTYTPKSYPSVVAFDTESLDKDPRSQATHLSWSLEPNVGYVCRWSEIPEIFLKWLHDPAVTIVAHNFVHDWLVMCYNGFSGIKITNTIDTMILKHIISTPRLSKVLSNTLKSDAQSIGISKWTSPLERWKKLKDKNILDWPPPESILLPYSAMDSVATLLLYYHWKSISTSQSWRCAEIECKSIASFTAMEEGGMGVDVPFFVNLREMTEKAILKAAEQLRGVSGVENVNSHVQLSQWLYGRLGLKCPKKTKNQGPSTDDANIEILLKQDLDEEVKDALHALVEYRQQVKRLEKCDAILAAEEGGRIHPRFKLTGTDTGRISSGGGKGGVPNTQNVERVGTGPLRFGFVSQFE